MRALAAAILTTLVPALAGQRWFLGRWPLRWALGALVGIATLDCGAILGGFAGHFELGAIGAVLLLGFVPVRSRVDLGIARFSRLTTLLLAAVALGGVVMMVLAFFRPVAYYDGWAMWSMKAKGLASAGGFDSPVFVGRAYSDIHQDYPPALSAWQAAAYAVSGDLTVSWPLQFQLAWLWTVGGIALVGLASRWSDAAAAIVLAWVAAPHVMRSAIEGEADVPMAILLVVATALLVSCRGRPVALWSGLLFAAAALTKVEGLVLVVAVLASLAVASTASSGLRLPAVWSATVALALALPWSVFTRLHRISNNLLEVSTPPLGRASGTPLTRLLPVLRTMTGEVLLVRRWTLLVPLVVVALLLGRLPPAARPLALGACLSTGTFVAVYLVTKVPYHLEGSVSRVVIAPLGLFALCAARGLGRAVDDPAPPVPGGVPVGATSPAADRCPG